MKLTVVAIPTIVAFAATNIASASRNYDTSGRQTQQSGDNKSNVLNIRRHLEMIIA